MSSSSPWPMFHGSVAFQTSQGILLVALFGRDYPAACDNLMQLCAMGYYTGSRVVRVVRDNFAQISVDPVVGNWTAKGLLQGDATHRIAGGGGTAISSSSSRLLTLNRPGIVLLAHDDTRGGTSQLTVTLSDRPMDYLLAQHTPLGVCIGEPSAKTLRRINSAALQRFGGEGGSRVELTSANAVLEGEPVRVIRIRRAAVVDNPFQVNEAAVRFDFGKWALERQRCAASGRRPLVAVSDEKEGSTTSIVYNAEELYGALSSDDDEDETGAPRGGQISLSAEELAEQQARVSRTRSLMLQLLGVLPDVDEEGGGDAAELSPPPNVLFVCKLNPLTQDDDLATCFRQFGTVVSCEIMRDRKTGRSLNYAFIEFQTKEQCERAYRKMDRVLIDDSRIHVDFSQSVANLWAARRRERRGRAAPLNEMHPPAASRAPDLGSKRLRSDVAPPR